MAGTSLVFALNGVRVEVPPDELSAKTSLNEYLRSRGHHGTKLSCGQGACGACTVAVSEWTAQGPRTRTVTSCLTPLVQVAGRSVTTVEGLGDKKGGQHPIQARLAHYFGSQCGFCTPGMVMQLYGVLTGTDGGRSADTADIERAIESGNMCRCTGYRPILDAGKSFCGQGVKSEGPTVVSEAEEPTEGPYDTTRDPVFPDWLQGPLQPLELRLASGAQEYLRPVSVAAAIAFLARRPEAVIISGYTSPAVHLPLLDKASVVLDVSGVAELRSLSASATTGARVSIGAAVTLEDLAEQLAALNAAPWAEAFARHLRLIASPQVRHRASLGGHLLIARARSADGTFFPSDAIAPLLALDADVEESSPYGATRTRPLAEWLTDEGAGPRALLVKVSFPVPTGVFDSYRVAARSRMCYADLSAAFWADIDASGQIAAARVAYGSLPDALPRRARHVEAVLQGRKAAELLPNAAGDLPAGLADALALDVPAASDFRRRLPGSLLAKFLLGCAGQPEDAGMLHGGSKSHVGSQILPPVTGLAPFGTAGSLKDKVDLQCNGKATFVDDFAMESKDALHAAVVRCLAPPRSKLVGVVVPQAATALGATFCGTGDVSENNWLFYGFPDRLFIAPGTTVNYWGEPFGVVVAPTQERANQAAALISQAAELQPPEGLPPVTDIGQVRQLEKGGKNLAGEGLILNDQVGGRGNADRAFAAAAGKKGLITVVGGFQKGGQLHWYMEPQSCFVELGEAEGKVTVHSATQVQEDVQLRVAQVLGWDMNKVEVRHRRCGGGFGGKRQPPQHFAAMAALAARKTGRPVRLVLPREVDSALVGGRPQMDVHYEMVVEEATGVIQAVRLDVLLGLGWTGDFVLAQLMGPAVDGCYQVPDFQVRLRSVRTDMAHTNTVRGPGHHEAALIMETLLDRAAHAVGMPPDVARERNFYALGNPLRRVGILFGVLPPLPVSDVDQIAKLFKIAKERSGYFHRLAEVTEFNASHKLRKRGLGISMTKFGVLRIGRQACLVNIYKDGSIVLHHSGCEIGQGLQTKAVQMVRRCISTALPPGFGPIPASLVQVRDNSTDVVPIGTTGASITSEMVCYAVEDACYQLLERLAGPIKEVAKLQPAPASSEAAWRKVLEIAYNVNIILNPPYLSAVGHFVASLDQMAYDTYSSGVVEVEVDGLTGEFDLRYGAVAFEVGPVLHGGVDVGQVEGAFVMGLGAMTTEHVLYDPTTSRLISDNTWHYKIPLARDLPATFDVELCNLTEEKPAGCDCCKESLKLLNCVLPGEQAKIPQSQRDASKRLKSAKATGEPPLCAATAVVSALRHAITAFGGTGFLELSPPVTVEQVSGLCARSMRGEAF